MILLVQVPDLKTYREDPQQVLDHEHACPACGHQPLARHGVRPRWFYTVTEKFRSVVFRLLCTACGVTVTLLPDILVPRFRYVAALIQEASATYLTSAISYRGLAVQLSGAVLPDDASTTDALLTIRMRPSYQRIHAWVKHLAGRAEAGARAMTTWLLRLRPDSHLVHLFATPIPTFGAKARSEPKRLALRAAALLVIFAHEVPELRAALQHAWLAKLSAMTRRLQGWPSLPDPPSS